MNVLLNNEISTLLRTPRLPSRLNINQVAAILGFQAHDIPVLVSKKLLRPLGRPAPNATKYFAARDIELLGNDPAWLTKATQSMYDHWQGKNQQAGKIRGSARISIASSLQEEVLPVTP